MLLHAQNAVPVVSTSPQNFYQCTSHQYWAKFSSKYPWLKSIFLGPDSNPMTHETWQIDHSNYLSRISKEKIFFFQIQKLGDFWQFFPKTVLGNLDPYSGTLMY
jgi:hypothetical protein